jgi:hypothetical protein
MTVHSLLLNGKGLLLLFILISFFAVKKICIPRNRKIKPADLLLLGHVFLLSAALYVIYAFFFLSVTFYEKKAAFNSSAWLANREKRIEMLDDLVDRKLLESRDTNAVIGMLGHPVRIIRDETRSALEFYTGFRNAPFEVDPTFLFVEITQSKVTDYYVIPGIPDIQ